MSYVKYHGEKFFLLEDDIDLNMNMTYPSLMISRFINIIK